MKSKELITQLLNEDLADHVSVLINGKVFYVDGIASSGTQGTVLGSVSLVLEKEVAVEDLQ